MPAHRVSRSRRGRRPSWAPAAAAGLLALGLGLAVLDDPPAHRVVQLDAAAQVPLAPSAQSAAPSAHPAAAAVPPPVRLTISRIGVDAPVESGGLNSDGTVEVPPLDRPGQVDWYRNGPAPGQLGPAVLLGHLDTRQGPAVFERLTELRPGDRIDIRRQDGSTVSYQVRLLRQFSKADFPTDLVYGNTDNAQLRLITCGGVLGGNGHYTDNIIVLADLVGS